MTGVPPSTAGQVRDPELVERIGRAIEAVWPSLSGPASTAYDLLRDDRNVFCTWVDLAAARGGEVAPWCRALRDVVRRQLERYHEVCAAVTAQGPTRFEVMKGSAIAARYPKPLLRSSGDLDLAVSDDGFWRAAAAVLAEGFTLDAIAVLPGEDGRPGFTLHAFRTGTATDHDDHVDLASAPWIGDLWHSRPSWQPFDAIPDPALRQLLLVAAERWERPFGLRDLIDTAVLVAGSDRSGMASLLRQAAQVGVGTALAELLGSAANLGLIDDDSMPDRSRRRGVPGVVGGIRRQVRMGMSGAPLRRLESAYMFRRRRLAGRVFNLVTGGLPARLAVSRGLAAFGVRVDDAPGCPDGAVAWRDRDRLGTPIGTFALTTGFELD